MRLRLKVLSYQRLAPGQQVEKILEKRGGSIGRSPTCDWRLPDPTRVVSGHHADIEFDAEGFSIVDRSTNGLFINHSEQAIGTGNRTVLRDGDVITLGEYEVQVTVEEMNSVLQPDSPVAMPDPVNFGASAASLPSDLLAAESESSVGVQEADNALSRLTAENSTPPAILATDIGSPDDFFTPPKMEDPAPVADKEWDANWLDQVAVEEEPQQVPSLSASPSDPDNMGVIPEDWEKEILSGDPREPTDGLDVYLPELELDTSAQQVPNDSNRQTEVRASAFDDQPSEVDVAAIHGPADTSIGSQGLLGADQSLLNQFPPAADAGSSVSESAPVEGAEYDSQQVADGVSAFFSGFGYKPEKMSAEEMTKFMQTAGVALREAIEGTLEALKSRSFIKGEIQANQTMIGASENNPLKFSVNFEDAVFNMFEKRVHGFLTPKEAIREAMHDIKTHQVGLMAGTEAVLHAMLDYLGPEQVGGDRGSHSLLGKIGAKDSKHWKEYLARHARIKQELEDHPQSLYAKEFAQAYEHQMEELKREAIRHLYQEPIF